MSDIPPPLEDQGPGEPDHPPPVRSRGIRGGKAARRKRTAYIRWVLQANPDLSVDQVAVIHQDKTQRPLYTRAGWTPDSLDEDDEEKTAPGTFRPPEPAGPPPQFPCSSRTRRNCASSIGAERAKSARPRPPVKAVPKAAREEGEISSADLGGGSLIINPLTNGKVKLADSDRLRVKRAVFFDFHNTIDRYFVPGRRKPSAIPWPNGKPVLIPEIVSVITRVLEAATEDTENLTCVSVLYINNSVEVGPETRSTTPWKSWAKSRTQGGFCSISLS